jgi:hypothetical protein
MGHLMARNLILLQSFYVFLLRHRCCKTVIGTLRASDGMPAYHSIKDLWEQCGFATTRKLFPPCRASKAMGHNISTGLGNMDNFGTALSVMW